MKHEENDPPNPGFMTKELCEAYRASIKAEIRGIKNTIIVGLSISTAIISIVVALIQLLI